MYHQRRNKFLMIPTLISVSLIVMLINEPLIVSSSSLVKKFIKKLFFFPTGFTVPLIVGITAPHPVENYHRVVRTKHDHGLHGYFGRYNPYDSQEWWPEMNRRR